MAGQINYYGPDDVRIYLDDESNNLIDISCIVQTVGDLGKEAKLADESQGFGKSWTEVLAIGVRMVKEVSFEVWLTGANPSASVNTIERIGSRALMKGVPLTSRTPTRTFRVVYGMPVPEPNEKEALVNNAAGYAVGARVLAVDGQAASGNFAVDEYVSIKGEAYRISAATATQITLHRGLLHAVVDDDKIEHIREYFAEIECHIKDNSLALDRSNASMFKAALRPTGEMVEF